MTAAPKIRQLIVRYRCGTPNDIEPDFDRHLAGIVSAIKAGSSPRDLVKLTANGQGQLVQFASTWVQIVAELFSRFERGDNAGRAWLGPLVSVLDILAADSTASECWLKTRDLILDNVDVLSSWDQTGFARSSFPGDIQREGDQYFEILDGQRVQVFGTRTTTEIRWDFIRDAAYHQYSPLNGVLRCVALRNICRDFRDDPQHYPPSVHLCLSEDQDGFSAFLHYCWQIPWPYGTRTLSWRPDCNQCDHVYLANDLVAAFADRAHIPERDMIAVRVSCDEVVFHQKTQDYPYQFEYALETNLIFGEVSEVWFNFQSRPIRWINQTLYMHTVLVIPTKSHTDQRLAYRLALEFLSSLVFTHRASVRIITGCGCGRQPQPFVRQPHKPAGLLVGDATTPISQCASGSPKALAIALFAEATSSGSVFYSFLNYWKVIELAQGDVGNYREKAERVKKWIGENLSAVYTKCASRIDELRKTQRDVANYLYGSNRCAVAHAKLFSMANPDNPDHRLRITADLGIVRELARKIIEDGKGL